MSWLHVQTAVDLTYVNALECQKCRALYIGAARRGAALSDCWKTGFVRPSMMHMAALLQLQLLQLQARAACWWMELCCWIEVDDFGAHVLCSVQMRKYAASVVNTLCDCRCSLKIAPVFSGFFGYEFVETSWTWPLTFGRASYASCCSACTPETQRTLRHSPNHKCFDFL